MKNILPGVVAALVIVSAVPAHASPFSIELGNYAVAGIYQLDSTFGIPGLSGLEASAVGSGSPRRMRT